MRATLSTIARRALLTALLLLAAAGAPALLAGTDAPAPAAAPEALSGPAAGEGSAMPAGAPVAAPTDAPAAMPADAAALPLDLEPLFVDYCGSEAACRAECRDACGQQYNACLQGCNGPSSCSWNCVLAQRTCYDNCDIF